MSLNHSLTFAVLLILVGQAAASAQSATAYTDPAGKFKLTLVGDWKAVSYNDAVGRQKCEFVYRDRSEGLLKVSRQNLTVSLPDFVRQEMETFKAYRAGFEQAANESFGGAGSLSGVRLSFYTLESNRQTASTYYFLQHGNTVWVLQFSGRRGSLDRIRNLTDQIARSFQPL
jgi:hypothetical protein